jgi:glutathione S-transferase
MTLQLIYFKMRALAEAPQLLLHYAGIEYKYQMSWDYYDKEWSQIKPEISFKQLPVLIVDGEHEIGQSIAILSYIEQLVGLSLSNPIIAGRANAIMQSAQELFAPLNPTVNFAVGEDFNTKRDDMTPFLLSRFDDLDRMLSSSGNKFFIDDVPRACDFAAFHHLDLSKKLDETLLNKFPRLGKFVDDITSINSVRTYLDRRPELIDVSVAPKLIIEGKPHPTGVEKT